MTGAALERVFRTASGRIIASLAVRFRNLSLAEDAFSESCLKAVRTWPNKGLPEDPAGWLYRVAERAALNELRRNRVREHRVAEVPVVKTTSDEAAFENLHSIPDERLRLIFICCHPALALESRAALTLRLVCGLSVSEIARAFLIQESTLAQRLVRAKHKIAEAGVPFELPAFHAWPERLQAVLSVLEIAYAKAHEDAAGTGLHAGFAAEVLHLAALLAELLPKEGEPRAFAAQVHYAEARRPARTDSNGVMVPLSDQDPSCWRRDLIAKANVFICEAIRLAPQSPRTIEACLQQAWCSRQSLDEAPPWETVLQLYNHLLRVRDDPIVRLNRAVALAHIEGPSEALILIEDLAAVLKEYLPYHAVRADLLRRVGRTDEARDSYAAAISLGPSSAEMEWLERRATET